MTFVLGAALVVGLAVAAWLATVETVLLALDPVTAVAQGADRDDDLRWLVEHRGTSLNVVLLATVVVRVTVTLLAYLLAHQWLPVWSAALVSGGSVVLVSLVLTEVAPRARAMRAPVEAGQRRARAARRLVAVLGPLDRVLVTTGRALAGGRGSGAFPENVPMAEGEDQDSFEEDERAMIRSIFELSRTMVREIMVPRPDMVTVEVGTSFEDLVTLLIDCGKSRIPVYREDREHIIGVIYAKDVLQRLATGARRRWIDLLRPATFVPETKPVDDLLEELQAASVHIALVVDEYGATTGLVTIEDILEEIVGEIVDEHDDESPLVEVLGDDSLRIDARLPVDDLAGLLGVDLPDDDWDTVGGLVVASFGRVPAEGEVVAIDSIEFSVERVTGRRVALVVASRRVGAPASAGDPS